MNRSLDRIDALVPPSHLRRSWTTATSTGIAAQDPPSPTRAWSCLPPLAISWIGNWVRGDSNRAWPETRSIFAGQRKFRASSACLLSLAVLAAPAFGAEAAAELNWYRGNTHTHTNNSDGDTSPDAVVRWYKDHDYHFVFITDHEYITDVAPLNALFGAQERFMVLPGQEVTQWGADPARSAAHINSLFATDVIWPMGKKKCQGSGCGATVDASVALADTFRTNIANVLAKKSIPQINHPNYHWAVKPEDLADIPAEGCLLEIWNGQRTINNLGGATDTGDIRPPAEGYWDYLLSRGKKVWGVASDDSHHFREHPDAKDSAPPGQAWIMVRAPKLSSADIESALRKGDFYASTGVTLKDLSNEAGTLSLSIVEPKQYGPRYLTKFIGKDGKVLAEVPGLRPSYRFKGDETYVRAAVIDSNGARAWTQPVFRRNDS